METKTALLIDNNLIDLFVNRKILECSGFTHIHCARNGNEALIYLKESAIKCSNIFVNIYLPLMDGFEFADKFNELVLNQKHGEIVILSASIDPLDIEKAEQRNIKFIEKPLSIEKLLMIK